MTTIFLYFFLALGVSFLCSLLESVLLSMSRTFIGVHIKDHPTSGRLLEKLKENINRPLAAILSLNTIANTVIRNLLTQPHNKYYPRYHSQYGNKIEYKIRIWNYRSYTGSLTC